MGAPYKVLARIASEVEAGAGTRRKTDARAEQVAGIPGGGKGGGRKVDAKLKEALVELKENGTALAAAQAEIKKLKAGTASPTTANTSDVTMGQGSGDTGPTALAAAAADAAIKEAAARLKAVKDIPESLRAELCDHKGGYEAMLVAAEAAKTQALAAKRGTKSLKEQVEAKEDFIERTSKSHQAAVAKVEATLAEQTELQKKLDHQRRLSTKLEEDLKLAHSELYQLRARAAEEQRAKAGAGSAGPAATEAASVGPLQVPTGCVSIAFAEEKWAEREAAVSQQIAQLQALVCQAETHSTAASEVSPSEVGELDSVEQLEEDEAWSKVERGRRKAVLRRERDVLAVKVRTSLAKVSCAASPFVKAAAKKT